MHLFWCMSKTLILAKLDFLLAFLAHSYEMLDLFGGRHYWDILYRILENQKKSHIVCHNLWQYEVRKTMRPILAWYFCLPMIWDTDLPASLPFSGSPMETAGFPSLYWTKVIISQETKNTWRQTDLHYWVSEHLTIYILYL